MSNAYNPAMPVLEIVSDVICPWCYVGKRRLALALEELDDLALTVRWRPYELNPTLPAAGMDRRSYCVAKFGSLEHANRQYARVVAAAQDDGLALNIERITHTPNTRAAHRLIEYAGFHGRQDAMVDALFEAYFVNGQDIGAEVQLIELAVAVGLERSAVTAMLADRGGDAGIEAAEYDAHELGVEGVPAFVYNGRVLFSGAQSPQTIARALQRAYARGL
jgi:predicted DsbA family dithiol-disulfide isomerase